MQDHQYKKFSQFWCSKLAVPAVRTRQDHVNGIAVVCHTWCAAVAPPRVLGDRSTVRAHNPSAKSCFTAPSRPVAMNMFRSSSSAAPAITTIPSDVSNLLNDGSEVDRKKLEETGRDDGILVQPGELTYANVPDTAVEPVAGVIKLSEPPTSLSALTIPEETAAGLSMLVSDLTPSLLEEVAGNKLSSEGNDDHETSGEMVLMPVMARPRSPPDSTNEHVVDKDQPEQHGWDTFLSVGSSLAASSEQPDQEGSLNKENQDDSPKAEQPEADHDSSLDQGKHGQSMWTTIANLFLNMSRTLVMFTFRAIMHHPWLVILLGCLVLTQKLYQDFFVSQIEAEDPPMQVPTKTMGLLRPLSVSTKMPAWFAMDDLSLGLSMVNVVFVLFVVGSATAGRIFFQKRNTRSATPTAAPRKAEKAASCDYKAWTVPELQKELRSRKSTSPKLPSSGLKQDLVRHLVEHDCGRDSSLVFLESDQEDDEPLNLATYEALTSVELKDFLLQRKCRISGEKSDLIRRLVKHEEHALLADSRAVLRRKVTRRGGKASPYKHGLVRTLIELGPDA